MRRQWNAAKRAFPFAQVFALRELKSVYKANGIGLGVACASCGFVASEIHKFLLTSVNRNGNANDANKYHTNKQSRVRCAQKTKHTSKKIKNFKSINPSNK